MLVRAVAVLGGRAELRHAAALSGLERELATHAATTLARADLLRFEMPLEFTHPVVRASVYEDMSAAERIAAHRRAATILADAGAAPEQVAAHLEHTVRLVASGRVRLKPAITHVLNGLDKVPLAFEITANKGKFQAINPAQVMM